MPQRVYIDSNVFIYLIDGDNDMRRRALTILQEFDQQNASLHTSHLTIAECTIAPIRDQRTEIVAAFHDLLEQSEIVELVAITRETVGQAAITAAHLRLKLPDAIHVATAEALQCDVFLTNDRGIRAPATIEIRHL